MATFTAHNESKDITTNIQRYQLSELQELIEYPYYIHGDKKYRIRFIEVGERTIDFIDVVQSYERHQEAQEEYRAAFDRLSETSFEVMSGEQKKAELDECRGIMKDALARLKFAQVNMMKKFIKAL